MWSCSRHSVRPAFHLASSHALQAEFKEFLDSKYFEEDHDAMMQTSGIIGSFNKMWNRKKAKESQLNAQDMAILENTLLVLQETEQQMHGRLFIQKMIKKLDKEIARSKLASMNAGGALHKIHPEIQKQSTPNQRIQRPCFNAVSDNADAHVKVGHGDPPYLWADQNPSELHTIEEGDESNWAASRFMAAAMRRMVPPSSKKSSSGAEWKAALRLREDYMKSLIVYRT